ncbi:MAG: 50S ribosomal protein L1 [Nanoarchaeota archaeon]
MDKKEVLEAIKLAKEVSKKRNFKQGFDLVINLKNINLKKPEENIDLFLQLPNQTGKKVKICALIDYDLEKQSKETTENIILKENFPKYENKKKELKKIARQYDFFIAQADIMPKIATLFGRILGPLGKMPNPKIGAVVPGSIQSLKPLTDKLRNTIRLQTKNEPTVKASIGNETMKDEEIADNFLHVYNSVLHSLPQEKNNVKSVIIKMSMGSPINLEKEYKQEELSLLIQKPKVKTKEEQ